MEIDLERIDTFDEIFPDEEKRLKCVISYETDSRLRVKIFNPDKKRYEVNLCSYGFMVDKQLAAKL
jgi:hypothetical protein